MLWYLTVKFYFFYNCHDATDLSFFPYFHSISHSIALIEPVWNQYETSRGFQWHFLILKWFDVVRFNTWTFNLNTSLIWRLLVFRIKKNLQRLQWFVLTVINKFTCHSKIFILFVIYDFVGYRPTHLLDS